MVNYINGNCNVTIDKYDLNTLKVLNSLLNYNINNIKNVDKDNLIEYNNSFINMFFLFIENNNFSFNLINKFLINNLCLFFNFNMNNYILDTNANKNNIIIEEWNLKILNYDNKYKKNILDNNPQLILYTNIINNLKKIYVEFNFSNNNNNNNINTNYSTNNDSVFDFNIIFEDKLIYSKNNVSNINEIFKFCSK